MSNNPPVFNAFSVTQRWDCLFLLWKCNILKHLNLVTDDSKWRGRLDLACDEAWWGRTEPEPASCGHCPKGEQAVEVGQGRNSPVMIVQWHVTRGSFCPNHTSFSWCLLAVLMEMYFKNCPFLTAKSQCCSMWDPCSVFLWLKINWVHKVYRNASVLPAVSLGERLSTLDSATDGSWRASGPWRSTCGFFVCISCFSFSCASHSPCSLFRYLLTMNGTSLQVERSSPLTTLQRWRKFVTLRKEIR